MSQPTVRLLAGAKEWVLSATPSIVPAGNVIISVTKYQSRTVILDGVKTYLLEGGLLASNLSRSTGYHLLQVDGCTFWFGTEDTKLGLEGIEAMLAHLRTLGTGWTGQALFSDGTALRDQHVVYAWLNEWADTAIETVTAILQVPRAGFRNTRALSRRGGRAVLLAPTLRLLRSSPRQYLQESSTGSILAGGSTYDPLRVVVRKRTRDIDTIANRRAVDVVGWVVRLCEEVLREQPTGSAAARCKLWSSRAATVLHRPLAQRLASTTYASSAPRQSEELTDKSYRTSYAIAQDLHQKFGWSSSLTPTNRFSYVQKADAIYQAYVASRLAQELGLTQTTGVLGREQPAFSGPRFDLYCDTKPLPEVLRSWRSRSSNPDTSRPDLLLHERDTNHVAILDAKYRRDPSGGVSEDSRKEVSAYMALYGLHAVSILYPGSGDTRVISGQGRSLIEVPVTPDVSLAPALPQIEATLQFPSF